MNSELKKVLREIRQELETEIIKHNMFCEGFSKIQNNREWLVSLIDQWNRRDKEKDENLKEDIKFLIEGCFEKDDHLKNIGYKILRCF